jgi:glutamyl-tRNA synthetase
LTPVRTRFAPSPTGSLHVGGVRTALYCSLWAKRTGGRFLLRIEDTDRLRSTEEAAAGILRDLRWLGLTWDEGPDAPSPCGPFFQSQRLDRYDAVIAELLAAGRAYEAWEEPAELEAMRKAAEASGAGFRYRRRRWTDAEIAAFRAAGRRPVVRLAAPHRDVTHDDVILGPVTVTADHLDDLVLRKTDGMPTYHFAVVVDDHDMGIDLILRGQEHLMNTHKHLLITEALGWTPPRAGHLPLIFDARGAKMSKREKSRVARQAARDAARPEGWAWLAQAAGRPLDEVEGFVARKHDGVATAEAIARALAVALPLVEVMDFRRAGFLPEAIINYMALLGWGRADDAEILTFGELVDRFHLDDVNTTAARFDLDKLRWVNAEWMKRLTDDRLLAALGSWLGVVDSPVSGLDEPHRRELLDLYRARAATFGDLDRMARFFSERPTTYEPKAVAKWLGPDGRAALAAARDVLATVDWTPGAIGAAFAALAEAHGGLGAVAQPLRVALTGTAASPEIERTVAFLSRAEVLARIEAV